MKFFLLKRFANIQNLQNLWLASIFRPINLQVREKVTSSECFGDLHISSIFTISNNAIFRKSSIYEILVSSKASAGSRNFCLLNAFQFPKYIYEPKIFLILLSVFTFEVFLPSRNFPYPNTDKSFDISVTIQNNLNFSAFINLRTFSNFYKVTLKEEVPALFSEFGNVENIPNIIF